MARPCIFLRVTEDAPTACRYLIDTEAGLTVEYEVAGPAVKPREAFKRAREIAKELDLGRITRGPLSHGVRSEEQRTVDSYLAPEEIRGALERVAETDIEAWPADQLIGHHLRMIELGCPVTLQSGLLLQQRDGLMSAKGIPLSVLLAIGVQTAISALERIHREAVVTRFEILLEYERAANAGSSDADQLRRMVRAGTRQVSYKRAMVWLHDPLPPTDQGKRRSLIVQSFLTCGGIVAWLKNRKAL
jgi:hypothetical protein